MRIYGQVHNKANKPMEKHTKHGPMDDLLEQAAEFLEMDLEVDFKLPRTDLISQEEWDTTDIKWDPFSVTESGFGSLKISPYLSSMKLETEEILLEPVGYIKWEPLEEEVVDNSTFINLRPVSPVKEEPRCVVFVGDEFIGSDYNNYQQQLEKQSNSSYSFYNYPYGYDYNNSSYFQNASQEQMQQLQNMGQDNATTNTIFGYNQTFSDLETTNSYISNENMQYEWSNNGIYSEQTIPSENLPDKWNRRHNTARINQHFPHNEESFEALVTEEDRSSSSSTPNNGTMSPANSIGAESAVQSQDEILEEIQRECAEIERRSHSSSPPDTDALIERRLHKTNDRITKNKRIESPLQQYLQVSSSTSPGLCLSDADEGLPKGIDRKKALNRVAATRYREKKRQEREQSKGELDTLDKHNRELRAELSSVEAEIKYLKGLIAEIQARSEHA